MVKEAWTSSRQYVGRRLQIALENRGITVADAAPQLGMSTVSLYRKLRGESPMYFDELVWASELTGRDFSYFFPPRGRR